MRIIADLTDKGISITGALAVPNLNIFGKTLNFLVDTGNDITALSEVEAELIEIDYARLPRARKPTISMGGVVGNHELKEVILILDTDEGAKEFEMDFIHVSRYPMRAGTRGERDRARLKALPNLLGRDFLDKYNIKLFADFGISEAYLECDSF